MTDKIFKQLNRKYILSISFMIITFFIEIAYTIKYPHTYENAVLERWAIIITLSGVFAALKIFHPQTSASEKTGMTEITKKYVSRYSIRLYLLIGIYSFNLICLHWTGIKNFIFLSLIVIFAAFFCKPIKLDIPEDKKENEEHQE